MIKKIQSPKIALPDQMNWAYDNLKSVIDMLDGNSLKEISGGYSTDVDSLLSVIEEEVVNIFSGDVHHINSEKFFNLDNVVGSMHESLKVLNYNYFKLTMMPEFYLSAHSIEWGNIIQLYPKTCILASRGLGKTYEFNLALPLWKMYGYRTPTALMPISRDIELRKIGLIVTNKFDLGKKILSDIGKYIKNSDSLRERLNPQSKNEGTLGKEYIETRNGCEVHLRSSSSSSRGLHPGWVIPDDFGDDSWIYSQKAREKSIEFFYGDIMKTLERGSTLNMIGTPFSEMDLYAHIKKNDKSFKFFEYPAILPDGTIVAPHRYTLKELEAEYISSGSLIFSREILCVPLSDSSTIFTWDILQKSFIGMQQYRLVHNRESFPIKFKFVSVGCDFAISANIKADSTVFTVWGIDELEQYWLLYVWRKQGAGYNEQIAKLKEIERNFRPNEIVAESNGFQKVMLQVGKDHGIKNITDFNTTAWNKKDLYNGLPSMTVLFEQSKIKFPRGDTYSLTMTDWLCSEFNSITIKPDTGKLESSGQHDDGAMSSFLGIKGISLGKKKDIKVVMI